MAHATDTHHPRRHRTGLPDNGAAQVTTRKFGQAVDVVVFGDTHEELVCWYDGVLFINPGSPTYPGRKHKPGSLGTVARLRVDKRAVEVELVQL